MLIWPTNQPTHPRPSTKNFIFPSSVFFLQTAGIMSGDETPREQPHLGLSVSQEKALLVLSVLLISSPNTPTPPELPLPKSVSKSDYSCVSSGWEIWPMAYWHLTSDLSSLPLSCIWSSAAGSNCMSSIRFIKSYAEYIEVFPSCQFV